MTTSEALENMQASLKKLVITSALTSEELAAVADALKRRIRVSYWEADAVKDSNIRVNCEKVLRYL